MQGGRKGFHTGSELISLMVHVSFASYCVRDERMREFMSAAARETGAVPDSDDVPAQYRHYILVPLRHHLFVRVWTHLHHPCRSSSIASSKTLFGVCTVKFSPPKRRPHHFVGCLRQRSGDFGCHLHSVQLALLERPLVTARKHE